MARDIKQLHPKLQEIIPELIEKCKKKGITIKIGECLRTVAEQDALYAKGRTVKGSIVTNAKGSSYSSMHQWGVAFDFYLDMDIDGDGKKSDDAFNNKKKIFQKVGQIGKELGLEWGGDWKSIVDLPHFQLKSWGSSAAQLKATYKTPEAFFKTWKSTSKKTSGSIYNKKQFIIDVQKAIGAKVDGIAGNETLSKTVTVSATKNRMHAVIRPIQKYLNALGYNCGTVDGIAGDKFKKAVVKYQKAKGCVADGEITAKKKTWQKLLGMC